MAIAALAIALTSAAPHAQIRYSTGQAVVPLFEGWMKNSDGSYNMVFAYLNRNFDEVLDIPVGTENFCDPAPQDCGQPTHFYTRRQKFVFAVKVPANWPKDRKMLWTLKSRGNSESAKGVLSPEYEIDYGTLSENGSGGILEAGNQPPKVTTGSPPQTVTIPQAASISVDVTDDGIPKPRAQTAAQAAARPAQTTDVDPARSAAAAARNPGIRGRWIQYRSPVGGKVTFNPERMDPVYGKPVSMATKATFNMPGTYVLRAIASDRQLETTFDVTVTVKAGDSR
jgi:hypothetical protein